MNSLTNLSSCYLLVSLTEKPCEELELPSWLEEKLRSEWTQQEVTLMREDLQRKYKRVKFTGLSSAPSAQMFSHLSHEEFDPIELLLSWSVADRSF